MPTARLEASATTPSPALQKQSLNFQGLLNHKVKKGYLGTPIFFFIYPFLGLVQWAHKV
jgi:hypothetical protein